MHLHGSWPRRGLWALVAVVAMLVVAVQGAVGQGLRKDEGHCTTASGMAILSCWNLAAGSAIPERLEDYPEFLPFLRGWDFRINLPHVRFQPAGQGPGSPTALAGVDEDGSAPTGDSGTLVQYGHRNNALWAFRVSTADHRLYAKQLPSRRNLTGSTPENVTSLTAGWSAMGSERFALDKPAAVVVGAGFGTAALHVAARREGDGAVLVTTRTIASTSPTPPPGAWTSLASGAAGRVSLAPAFGGGAAIAWRDGTSSLVRARLYSRTSSTWGPVVELPGTAAGDPQLVWTGSTLELFVVSQTSGRLRQAYAVDPSLAFRDQVDVAAVSVRPGAFSAIAWNGRLHVAFVSTASAGVQYTTTVTPAGTIARWVAPSPVGLTTIVPPALAALADNLFVVGVSSGRVRFARRDPNRPGPEVTGAPVPGIWLTAGQQVEPGGSAGYTGDLDALTWNGDVYLAAGRVSAGGTGVRLRLVNLSRAAFKHLVTTRWGIKTRWGELGGGDRLTNESGPLAFAKGSELPAVGDVDGNGESDLIKFTQRREAGVGPAPVYVARAPGLVVERWHSFFSLKGEIPLVGDFNGDGKDDIVTFVQKQQKDAAGNSLGPAPVWVSLSDGTRFQTSRIWHRFFSLKGEIPQVGDFNGDGKDDIVTFVQKQQKDAGGKVIGQAPVWVSLSNGTRFQTSRVWHPFFSLKGELPLVGDFDLDGTDDIVTFMHDRISGERARIVLVALARGGSFGRSFTWMSDFAAKADVPAIGTFGGNLGQITGRPQDASKRTADIFVFRRSNGNVYAGTSMGRVPYPSGAPWERYKWFTEKGLGVAGFPEWIWQRPRHCVGNPHAFVLLGAGGSGGDTVTNLSVRSGSRAAHVLEELGHSTFANCFRKTSDPMYPGIYTSAGVDAGNLWGGGPMASVDCPGGASAETIPAHPLSPGNTPVQFYDCRKDVAEHYFLELLRRYKLFGDEFRDLINRTTDVGRRARLIRQYTWLKTNWFGGAEFKRGPAVAAGLTQEGLLCLPGECAPPAVTTVIDFDDLTTGGPGGAGALVVVGTQYAPRGANFNNVSAIDYAKGPFAVPGFARSGSVAVEPCVGVEFCTTPVRITFVAPKRMVRVHAGLSFGPAEPIQVQLRALSGGSVVGSASATLGPSTSPVAIRVPLEVRVATDAITQVEVTTSTGYANGLALDDVAFEGG